MSWLSLVRYKINDYSVPVVYGYQDVLVRGYDDVACQWRREVGPSTSGYLLPARPRKLHSLPVCASCWSLSTAW